MSEQLTPHELASMWRVIVEGAVDALRGREWCPYSAVEAPNACRAWQLGHDEAEALEPDRWRGSRGKAPAADGHWLGSL